MSRSRISKCVRARNRHAQFRGSRFQNAGGFRALPREDRRDARLQNPGFLPGDGLDGVAQVRLVIEIDRRDHGEGGLDHVGRVQASAQAHFDHSGVYELFS